MFSYETKHRDLQSGWVLRIGVQGLARAYEIYHKVASIFLSLMFSVLLQIVSWEA